MSSINLLEKNLQKILRSAGFEPEHRVDLNGYEIDVLVEYKSTQIVFECKQYQRGNLTVRNLIHQWSGKQEELEVDRVVLVLVGVSVNEEAYELAESRGLQIWEGEKIEKLLDGALDGSTNLREEILLDLKLDSDEEIEETIAEYQSSYGATRKTVVQFLRGELSRYMFKKLSSIESSLKEKFDEGFDVLEKRDKKRYREKDDYYGVPFRKIARKMGELGIKDKKVARLFVNKEGGSAHGEEYYKRELKRIEFVTLNFDLDFKEAKSFDVANNPKMKTLRKAKNVKSDRPDIELEEIYYFLKQGYDVSEIKSGRIDALSHEDESINEGLSELSKKMDDAFEEGIDALDEEDLRKYKNNEKYYNSNFREVVEKMVEVGIKDKRVARLFVGDTGGTAHGEKYSKRDVKKIKLLMKEFDHSFETVKKFVFLKAPKMRMIRRAVNVHTERRDLQFDEIYKYLEEGLTVREIKNLKRESERVKQETEQEETEREPNATDAPENEEKQSSSEDSSSDTGEDEKDGDEEGTPIIINSSGELVTSEDEGHPPVKPSNEKAELDETETATAVVAVGLILLVVLLLVFG